VNVVFLHLSDIHLDKQKDINSFQLKKIADALCAFLPFEKLLLILSGDLANSGTRDQYSNVYKLVGNLIKHIKDSTDFYKYIDIFVVPGNHDVDLSNNPLDGKQLTQIRKNNSFYKYVESELARQNEFRNFAERNNLFLSNAQFDRKLVNCGENFRIEVNMINSAMFSTLEDDKGLHFVSQDVINEFIIPTGADFVVTIMHHPSDWFVDSCKNSLENAIYSKTSLLFFGHEHYLSTKQVFTETSQGVFIQSGGCLSEYGSWEKSQFHIGKLDTKNLKYTMSQFSWNKEERQYEDKGKGIFTLSSKPSIEKKLAPDYNFQKSLLMDIKQGDQDFRNRFIFPRIVEDDSRTLSPKEFIDYESFSKQILKDKKVIIHGGYNAGKTALLKWIFLELSQDYIPILCTIEQIGSYKPKHLIKSVFKDIYGENESDFTRFCQTPKKRKVILIDDVDRINKKDLERFVEAISSEFEYIIFASKDKLDLDLLDRMKAYLNSADTIYAYKIAQFYSDKREELVKKTVDIYVDDPDTKIRMSRSIAESLKLQRRMINLDPDFIIKYTSLYCKNIGDSISRDNNVFSKVFEASISDALTKNAKRISVDKAFVLLSKLAYHVHFEKLYPLPTSVISSIIADYNENYGSDVDFKDALDMMVGAQILIPTNKDGDYRFANVNYLAYFIARELNSQYQATGVDVDLQHILKHITFGINADVILFITYITDNIRILRFILNTARHYTQGWEEFKIDDNMPEFLKFGYEHEIQKPEDDEYQNYEKEELNTEKEILPNIHTTNIYDYEENTSEEILNQIIRAHHLLKIVAKCLPIFEHIMPKAEKEQFVELIYSLPNQIFQRWASVTDETINDLLYYLKEQSLSDYTRGKSIKSDKEIIRALQHVSTSILLEFYSLTMRIAVKDNTIGFIQTYSDFSNELNQLQKLMIYEVASLPKEFVNMAIQLDTNDNHMLFNNLLRQIVRHGYIMIRNLGLKEKQQLTNNFFNSTPKLGYRSPGQKQKARRMNTERQQYITKRTVE